MTEDEYIEKRQELKDAFKKQLREFDVTYSKSIQKYQIGDIVGDYANKIVITKVDPCREWGGKGVVQPYYIGTVLTIKGVPRMDGAAPDHLKIIWSSSVTQIRTP